LPEAEEKTKAKDKILLKAINLWRYSKAIPNNLIYYN
jgi:hypothetical protein